MFEKLDGDYVIKLISDHANRLGKKVFVVGGAVRDALWGLTTICKLDVDIAGNLTMDELCEMLEKNNLQYKIKNKKLQVVSFWADDNTIYEYARMRRESYDNPSSHVPSRVEFVDDVVEDSKRRDFTINSIYYDRHSSLIIDPQNGMEHLKNKEVVPVLGEETLKVDPARVIRYVELVCRFGLNADKTIEKWVEEYSKNVPFLSKERLNKELSRLLVFPKYENEDVKYLKEVDLMLSKLNLQVDKFRQK